jgi:hypothetical protein
VGNQPAPLLAYESILAKLWKNLIGGASGPEALQRLMKGEFAGDIRPSALLPVTGDARSESSPEPP